MQEILEQFRDRLAENPLVTLGQVIGMLVTGIVALRYAWKGTKGTGRLVHRAWTTPPSHLAAAILEALDGETLSDGVSVLAGGVQVFPLAPKRVYIDSVCIDDRLSLLDMNRISQRAATVNAVEKKRREELEVAGLVAKVKPFAPPVLTINDTRKRA